jgi:invasion protein IalB
MTRRTRGTTRESKDIRLPAHTSFWGRSRLSTSMHTGVRVQRAWSRCLRAVAVGLLFAVAHFAQAVLVPTPAQAVDAPEGTVKSQHGDWQVVCKDPPPGAKNPVCALVQSVTAEDKNNIGLTVYFQKFSNGTRVLRVFAPLGVLLPPGLGLKIDDKDVGHAPFLRCHSFACYAQVVVEDPLIEQLKHGKTAIFIIFQTEEAGIGIPISLKGFAEALDDLNK